MTRRRLALGILLAVVVAAVGVDRMLVWRAEQAIADRVGCADAEADVSGFPIVPQVIGGRLDDVVVEIPDLTRAGVAFDLRAELEGVRTEGSPQVDRVEATATVGWAELAGVLEGRRLLGGGLADARLEAENDAIAVQLGGAVGARLIIDVAAEGEQIVLRPVAVEVAGQEVSPAAVKMFTGRDLETEERSFTPGLPEGFSLSGAAAEDDGLAVTVVADAFSPGAVDGGAGICADSAGALTR